MQSFLPRESPVSSFEIKLYEKILSSMNYTYEISTSKEDLEEKLKANNYKVVLFDKECHGIELEQFTKFVADLNKDTKLVLVSTNSEDANEDDSKLVSEVISNSVNKEMLEELFKKYI